MEDYVKDAKRASMEDDIVGLYDRELHEEKLRITELEEAREKGLAAGINEGILETARKLLQEKVDIDTISRCTGLTKEEIESLK